MSTTNQSQPPADGQATHRGYLNAEHGGRAGLWISHGGFDCFTYFAPYHLNPGMTEIPDRARVAFNVVTDERSGRKIAIDVRPVR